MKRKNKFIKYVNKKKLRRQKKKRGEDIPVRDGEEKRKEEKELRREEKEREGHWCFFTEREERRR